MLHSQQECDLEKAEEEAALTLSQGGFDGYSWVAQNSEESTGQGSSRRAYGLALSLCFIASLQLGCGW
jgi:hypothetical protein